MALEAQIGPLEWQELRDAVWDDCFRAKARSRYYRARARKLGVRGRVVGVTALVAQSAVLVSILANGSVVAGIMVLVANIAGGAAIVGLWAAERVKYGFAASLADNQEHVWDELWRRVRSTSPGVGFHLDFRSAQTHDNEIVALVGDDGQDRKLLLKIQEQLIASLNSSEVLAGSKTAVGLHYCGGELPGREGLADLVDS